VAAAAVCLGAGGIFAVALQGASFGRMSETSEATALPVVVDGSGPAPAKGSPTLAIDVRQELKERAEGQLPVERAKQAEPSSPGGGELGSPHTAHLRPPWGNQPPADEAPEAEKAAEKRAVWLE
jgi:hypothetical protein